MSHRLETESLFYCSKGNGPLVIMLHGLLMDGRSWVDNGFLSTLSASFTVVCPDLIGHGASDKTEDQACYTRENQAAAIVKLMDKRGDEKAHVVGYSAGTWLAMELLKTYPERLHSVVLGGWDCVNGLPETPLGKLSFEMFMAYARETAPELTASLTPRDESSAESFFNELSKPCVNDRYLLANLIPKLLWAGKGDPYFAVMAKLAEKYKLPLIAGEGDHLGEVNHPSQTTLESIAHFIQVR